MTYDADTTADVDNVSWIARELLSYDSGAFGLKTGMPSGGMALPGRGSY